MDPHLAGTWIHKMVKFNLAKLVTKFKSVANSYQQNYQTFFAIIGLFEAFYQAAYVP